MLHMHLNSKHFKLLSKDIFSTTKEEFEEILYILKNIQLDGSNIPLLTMFFNKTKIFLLLKKAKTLNMTDMLFEKKMLKHFVIASSYDDAITKESDNFKKNIDELYEKFIF